MTSNAICAGQHDTVSMALNCPRQPMQNGIVGELQRAKFCVTSVKQEHMFTNLNEARKHHRRMEGSNTTTTRPTPHSSLNGLTPMSSQHARRGINGTDFPY